MSEILRIDGRQGEGGGQVVRSCLSLACITGIPFRINHVRANRAKPGLKHQHVTAVRAAAAICQARVVGDQVNSDCLEFFPQRVAPGDYRFDIGTAGSTTLVLQTILPALMVADSPSSITLTGGTHNPLAPSFEFLARAFLPIVRSLGIGVTAQLARYGFYPAGGGEIVAQIEPSRSLQGLRLLESGRLLARRVEAVVAGLPRHIAEREVQTIVRQSGWDSVATSIHDVSAVSPGNAVCIELDHEHVTEVFAACGRRGVPAEKVAAGCLREALDYLRQKVPVGIHLADQVLLPLALVACLAGAPSQFRTCPLSLHALTQIAIIQRFLSVSIDHTPHEQSVLVRVEPGVSAREAAEP